jgi:hypothetical protein
MFCLKSNFFNHWYFITSYRAYDQNSLPRFTIKGVFITSLIFCYHVIICSSENIAYMQGKKVTAILYQRQSIMPCMISFWGLYWILVLNVRRSRRSISVCQQWWAGPKMELSNICQSGLGGKFMGGKVQVYRWRGKRRWWSGCFKQSPGPRVGPRHRRSTPHCPSAEVLLEGDHDQRGGASRCGTHPLPLRGGPGNGGRRWQP